ncbi:MAG TPA: hypothetical protein VI318_15350 [Baekduia sp.]
MNAPSTLPTPISTPKPSTRPRRIKRGVVAGYIHDISPRHRASERLTPSSISLPHPVSTLVAASEPQPA